MCILQGESPFRVTAEFKDGKFHGKGAALYHNGDKYIGDFFMVPTMVMGFTFLAMETSTKANSKIINSAVRENSSLAIPVNNRGRMEEW